MDSGKSVIVIEHHQAVMAHADWIIDLGPGAGHDGGRIVFEGTPADLVASSSTPDRRAPRRLRRRVASGSARIPLPVAGVCGTIVLVTSRTAATLDLTDLVWLRRVRDRIDREYAEPLDVEALARGATCPPGT